MEETWDYVSVHWQQGNYQLWANCFMCWNPVAIAGIRVSRQHRHPLLCQVSWPLGHDLSAQNGLALVVKVSHTRHNNEPTLSKNDSPLGCLYLALAYRFYFSNIATWWLCINQYRPNPDRVNFAYFLDCDPITCHKLIYVSIWKIQERYRNMEMNIYISSVEGIDEDGSTWIPQSKMLTIFLSLAVGYVHTLSFL